MNAERLSQRWFLLAVTYFVVGIGFGVYMGASGNHGMFPVHAHINLLGWASMAITGLLYRVFPEAARTRAAAWHFWMYNIATPAMLLAIFALYLGVKQAEPVAGVAAVVILASVLLFWYAVFSTRSAAPAARPRATPA
jgi:hypothetical protein